jgi:hypothetical protein
LYLKASFGLKYVFATIYLSRGSEGMMYTTQETATLGLLEFSFSPVSKT